MKQRTRRQLEAENQALRAEITRLVARCQPFDETRTGTTESGRSFRSSIHWPCRHVAEQQRAISARLAATGRVWCRRNGAGECLRPEDGDCAACERPKRVEVQG